MLMIVFEKSLLDQQFLFAVFQSFENKRLVIREKEEAGWLSCPCEEVVNCLDVMKGYKWLKEKVFWNALHPSDILKERRVVFNYLQHLAVPLTYIIEAEIPKLSHHVL